MRVLVLRPQPSARRTATKLREMGHHPVLLPLTRAQHDVEAVRAALKILPIYGTRLQGQLRNLQFTLEQQAVNVARLSEVERLKHERLMAEEAERFRKQAEAAKTAGVRWRPVNQRDGESLKATLALVQKEIQRLGALDLEAMENRAELLYQAETKIAEEDIEGAEETLKTALNVRGSGRASRSKDPFVASIQGRLDMLREKAEKAAALENRANTRSGQLTQQLANVSAPDSEGETAVVEGDGSEEEAKPDEPEQDDLTAALMGRKGSQTPKSKAENPAPKKKQNEPKAKEKRSLPPQSSGGGFKIQYVFFLLPVLLIGATAFIYLKGQKEKAGG